MAKETKAQIDEERNVLRQMLLTIAGNNGEMLVQNADDGYVCVICGVYSEDGDDHDDNLWQGGCPVPMLIAEAKRVEAGESISSIPQKIALLAVTVVHAPSTGDVLWTQRQDDKTWEFPGGVVEGDEVPLMCAVREVWEETGLGLNERTIRCLGVFLWFSVRKRRWTLVTAFDAEALTEDVNPDPGEVNDWRWVPKHQEMPDSSRLMKRVLRASRLKGPVPVIEEVRP